jgi:hypothetical protein
MFICRLKMQFSCTVGILFRLSVLYSKLGFFAKGNLRRTGSPPYVPSNQPTGYPASLGNAG